MRLLLALLPAAACAAFMLVCMRGMRPSEMRTAEPGREDPGVREEVEALRDEVARLRGELDRARAVPLGPDDR